MGWLESLYEYLYNKSNNIRSAEPLLLLSMVLRKNRILKFGNLNLEDHICGRFERTNYILDKVLNYYKNIRKGKRNHLETYNKMIDEFKHKYERIVENY